MRLKYANLTAICLFVSAGIVSAKRRRRFKNNRLSKISQAQFLIPGSNELFQSLIDKEVESDYLLSGLDKEFDEEQQRIAMTLGDRSNHRPGNHNKHTGKAWPISGNMPIPEHLTTIKNAGGIAFCRELSKIDPKNIDKFIKDSKNEGKWKIISTYADYKMLKDQCDDLYALMAKRRAACTKTLLDYYNPRRKWVLKPHHKARIKYCRKIVKLRNPYTACSKKCAKTTGGNLCRQQKNQCTCKLNKYLDNNRAMVSGDRSNLFCRELPKGMRTMPGERHPLNEVLKCGRRICDVIEGSEMPWCDIPNKKNKGGDDRAGFFASQAYISSQASSNYKK